MTNRSRCAEVSDPAPDALWEVWYEDVFDKECPRQVEKVGQRLVAGLTELWARHLFETVLVDGKKGFSRFDLWWKQKGISVQVIGAWGGMVRLREWVFGNKQQAYKGYVEQGDKGLLMRLAKVHGCLVLSGQTSEGILAAAESCARREDFERQLLSLERGVEWFP